MFYNFCIDSSHSPFKMQSLPLTKKEKQDEFEIFRNTVIEERTALWNIKKCENGKYALISFYKKAQKTTNFALSFSFLKFPEKRFLVFILLELERFFIHFENSMEFLSFIRISFLKKSRFPHTHISLISLLFKSLFSAKSSWHKSSFCEINVNKKASQKYQVTHIP